MIRGRFAHRCSSWAQKLPALMIPPACYHRVPNLSLLSRRGRRPGGPGRAGPGTEVGTGSPGPLDALGSGCAR